MITDKSALKDAFRDETGKNALFKNGKVRKAFLGRLPMVGAGPSGPVRRHEDLGETLDASDVVIKKRALDADHGVAGAALVDARSPTDGRRRAFRSRASTRPARRGARRRGRRR